MGKLYQLEAATGDHTTRFLGDSGLSGSTMSRDVFLTLLRAVEQQMTADLAGSF